MKTKLLAAATFSVLTFAQPALAQDDIDPVGDDSWTGLYVGGRLGLGEVDGGRNETVLFDNNLDGTFGDTVRTAAGADAFSPGFCGGRATAPTAANGCRGDSERTEYGAHVGFDYDFGGIVVGVLGEYGRSNVRDSVTAFSTTPANYVLTRRMKDHFAIRARAGFGLGNTLIYGTGGGVYAKIENSFSSTNVANAFAASGSEREYGYQFGGGIEHKVSPNFSIGALFLMTNVEDDEARVSVTRGTAPLTNPFLLVNPNGTTFARSRDEFKTRNYSVTASFRF